MRLPDSPFLLKAFELLPVAPVQGLGMQGWPRRVAREQLSSADNTVGSCAFPVFVLGSDLLSAEVVRQVLDARLLSK